MPARKATPLENFRRARTLSQAQMADLLGVTQPTYSKYEAGRIAPPDDIRARAAAILGTTVDTLWPQSAEARP